MACASMSYWMARLVAVMRTRSVAGARPCSCVLSWTRWPRNRGSVSSPASISTASGTLPGVIETTRERSSSGCRRRPAQLAFENDSGAGRRAGRPRGAGHQDAARVVGHQRLIDGGIVVGDDAGDGQDAASAPLLEQGDGGLDAESHPRPPPTPAPACRQRSCEHARAQEGQHGGCTGPPGAHAGVWLGGAHGTQTSSNRLPAERLE